MNIRNLLLSAAILMALPTTAQNGGEARLLRFPTTNGREIAFSYAGDLYSVPANGGQARRLTSHIGYEMFARYSPDGSKIAFTGEYDGNREVYVIPSQGGEPRRLTFTSTNSRDDLGDRMGPNNIVMCWTPDGKKIIYRNRIGDGFNGKLWAVPAEGGMPEELPLPEGGFCSWSPDGSRLAFNLVMREFRTWKYYRGGMADDIHIFDTRANKVTTVTDNPAQDIFPMWVGDKIYFASDRDMTMNLFAYDTKSGTTTKVTGFTDFDIKFPSTDGKTIVFEKGGYIWKFDPSSGKSSQVPVTLGSDVVYSRSELMNVSGWVREYGVSPDGTRLLLAARGEIFDVPVASGVTRDISNSPGSNDRSPAWSPDGKHIAWIGDGSGETEVYIYDVEKRGESKMLTKGSDTYIRSIQWTPDSKHIIATDRKNRIVDIDPVSGSRKTLLTCSEQEIRGLAISPDSKWLAYGRPAHNDMNIIYVMEIASGKEYPVTEKWYNSYSPRFSSDGKYLTFSSTRNLNPIYSRIEWNFAMTDVSGVYMVMLASGTPSPLLPSDGEKAAEKPAPKDEASKPGDKPDKTVDVKIDPDGLAERIVQLPVPGEAGVLYCDGKKVWFWSRGATSVYDFATRKTEKCVDGYVLNEPWFKSAIIRKGQDLHVAKFGAKMAPGDKISLSDMVAEVDYSQEWPEIFDEVWRAFRDGFYLENMHGRDWKALKKKYSALLPYVRTRLDLNYVIGGMISELACGHAYVSTGDYPKAPRLETGLFGAKISKDKSGWFRVDRILHGAPYSESLRSPFEEPGSGVKEGDYITAVDGKSVKDVANIYSMMVGKAGKLTELTVNSSPAEGGKKVVIKPISDEYPLYHYEWVQKNIKTVEEKSGGKVGYIYIPDMGPEGLKEFARYYYPQLDKEALIIDDRGNGGGNISPMIIERLQRKVYRMTMSRTSSQTGTVPDGTHTGPKVLLINKYSASDGDLFPWSFKANGLGTVIGTRTWGGIIGISGSLPYMDGTDVRVPFFTNYDSETGQWIVENHGVDPDIVLDNDPVKEYQGIDEQLLKAIEVALDQIKSRKPLPGVPAPRTFKDLGLPDVK